ncbi:ATP-binding protein [Sinanaerobacter sp. ZZT-01]|uniref:ATP-binding protein n=1 Tax=Sinanaerobacter sp. ZZT-01 TaxID=3111540 RepID=UPI002D769FCD|nr:ATP-binding protein [Sinanaerobacter sp. ZZT-01]WRR93326.1 ATP-binding protein [Sinanaerobacter sp. ZZT-01]
MKKVKTTFLVATCIALASQVSVNLYTPGFTITLAGLLLPVFLYFNREFNPLEIALITGIVSPVYRGLIMYVSGIALQDVAATVLADVMFYVIYGALFYLLFWQRYYASLTSFFIATMISDFFANAVEISILMRLQTFRYEIFQTLALVAFARATIDAGIILFYGYYKSLLSATEHEERYRKLVLITSKIKSEIYFMNKNNADIETVMKKAYNLYKELSKSKYEEDLRNDSLEVAKDVHEIKKDYLSVIRGLEEMFDNGSLNDTRMSVADIAAIIIPDIKDYIRRNRLDISFDFKIDNHFYIINHYYFVSVLRNLIFNSIESMEGRHRGYIQIALKKDNGYCFISVEDNGSGISRENLEYIFNMGFSTKFNVETGDICRGIGLYHVKDIVEGIFSGEISVNSELGKGTKFTIQIDAAELEGRNE